MEVHLFIDGNMYHTHTLEAWQNVWEKICKMAYEGTDICEEIVTYPGFLNINGRIINDRRESAHTLEYRRLEPVNSYFLTLENMWKQFSHLYADKYPLVVPEFKKLVVPYCLYNCLGVNSWFKHSFPNCKLYFWEE